MTRRILFVVCLLSLLLSCTAIAAEVNVGLGSYLTNIPGGVGSPPATIYKTANVTGAMPTNDWWSSLAWSQYSSKHFAHPLAMGAQSDGLRVSYPGPSMDVYATGYIAPFQNEFVLGHSNTASFPSALVDGFSDWFVDVLFAQGSDQMRVSYGHGSPFVYAQYQNGGAKITFDSTVTLWSGDSSTPTLGITVLGRHYGLFGPTGSTWSGLGGQEFVNNNAGATHFSLAVLPDSSSATLAFFEQYAYAHVVDTQVQWNYNAAASQVETDYVFQTVAYEGSETGTIFALYPHQWKNTNTALLSYTYASVRGSMKVGAGSSFTTQMTFHGVLPSLPDAGSYDPAVLSQYLDQAVIDPVDNPSDTYWCGKSLKVLANLIPIAEQLGDTAAETHFTDELASRLETWFDVPANLQDVRYFAYVANWGSLIGVNPSYGSDSILNDHHFHYGYFVRGAAEIARKNKAWASQSQWGGMVDLIIRDYANADRNDTQFPFLRNFDPYAGHSWASGNATNDLGNNQESSSEAMNAWTGLILWGQATDNQAIRDLGIYLYTTEMNAINNYWYDVDQDIFPAGYAREAVGIIWGSKVDFLTYFGGNPQYIVGINILPPQLYQGLYPDYVQRNLQGVADLRGGSWDWDEWHDIGWMYEAQYDADIAMARFQAGSSVLDSHTKTNVYHWIGNFQAMGQLKRQVTSDYPTAAVFSKGDVTTYVAENITQTPATVSFSDGTQITVQPGEFKTATKSLFPSVSITAP
ncbi:MAG: glycosyl hydrolase, partial [Planctomycetota bacterium]